MLDLIVANQLIKNQHAYDNASRTERSRSIKITAKFADIMVQHAVNLCQDPQRTHGSRTTPTTPLSKPLLLNHV